MERIDKIRELSAKWLEGSATKDEERELSDLFNTAGNLREFPDDLAAVGVMLRGLNMQRQVEISRQEPDWDRIEQASRHRRTILYRIGASAAAAILIAAMIVPRLAEKRPAAEAYACIDGIEITDPAQVIAEAQKIFSRLDGRMDRRYLKTDIFAAADRSLSKLSLAAKKIEKAGKPLLPTGAARALGKLEQTTDFEVNVR